MKKYVLGFMFTEDKKRVVLIRKNKPEWQAGRLNGVGGKLEEGESPHKGMFREFFEETGCEFHKWKEFAVMTNSQFIVHCFVGYSIGLNFETTTDEVVEICEVVDVLTNKYTIIDNLKWLITMSLDDGFEAVLIKYFEADKYTEPVK